MTTYQVMSWRGIPVQVKSTDDAGTVASRQLPGFFQQEVDRVAMAEDLIDSDAYLEAWTWSEPVSREGTVDEVAEAVAAEVAEAWMRANRPPAG